MSCEGTLFFLKASLFCRFTLRAGIPIKIEKNIAEGEQKFHGSFRKDFGPLTVQQIEIEGDITRGADNLFYSFIYLFYCVMVGMATRANNNHIQGAGIGC